MDIRMPTNVRHIAHVTFDRLNGFLGLPIEFELEIPRRVPSASASAFGVSAESMQCSFDAKGNSVPTLLLLLQERLYDQGGLKTEGIFRINPENSKEEHLRDQLNKGIVPYDIDVHCLAGLIKAWFRELPKGVLDSLLPEEVMQCHTEDHCLALVKSLPPTQAALMDWAINLMADVVQEEACNKMNARNIAVVFAPNMTQMSDPLMALTHAVQVMNLLKTLILKALKDREESDKTTHFIVWNEPLNGDEAGYNSTRLWQALPNDASSGGTSLKGTLKQGALTNGETQNKYIAGELEILTKAFEECEIVEENGSTSSEWTYSAYSSTRGSRDEDEGTFDDQGRCVDRRYMMGNEYFDSVGNDLVAGNRSAYQQIHKPLADWLHYETLSVIKGQCQEVHAFDDLGPCSNKGSAYANGIRDHPKKNHFWRASPRDWLNRKPSPASKGNCEDEHTFDYQGLCSDGLFTLGSPNANGCRHASHQLSHKPLADWLHRESSPAVKFQRSEKSLSLEKAEKPIIKMPAGQKLAPTACHERAKHPLSKRTHRLKTNGVV